MHTCCFTGHRPEKLSFSEDTVRKWLALQIDEAIENGSTRFISGMQRGVDLWAAELVLERRNAGSGIRLIAACAFPQMENGWEASWQEAYETILAQVDEKYTIAAQPDRKAYLARDRWMVDRSSKVIAVYSGSPGGTRATINYAVKNQIDVVTFPYNEPARTD